MSTISADPFEKLLRDAGQGYLIDWYAPKNAALPGLRRLLDAADRRAGERLGDNAPRLTPEHLVAEFQRNPQKVQAFLQVLTPVSPDMLVMAWRILQGMRVQTLRVDYLYSSHFRLHIELSSPYGGDEPEVYESENIDDAAVLRHLGIMKMDNRPVFDGFYALNLEGPTKPE